LLKEHEKKGGKKESKRFWKKKAQSGVKSNVFWVKQNREALRIGANGQTGDEKKARARKARNHRQKERVVFVKGREEKRPE